jgi:hypothetical protein
VNLSSGKNMNNSEILKTIQLRLEAVSLEEIGQKSLSYLYHPSEKLYHRKMIGYAKSISERLKNPTPKINTSILLQTAVFNEVISSV